ncbi:MAG: EAL domain-containing protein, partial [Fervidobacterium sp.]
AFALSLTTFIIELLLVKMNWKKASFGAAMFSFKNSSDPIILLDNDQNIIDLNSASADLLKVNPLNVDKIKGKRNSLIEEIISKDGQIIKFDQRYFYVTFQKSQDYATLILKDITNEFTTRQLVEQFSALFNSLFENVPDGVIILTKDGVIINCNTQFVKMFGYSKEEVLGQNIDTLIVPSNLSDEPMRLRELVSEQKMLRVETTRKRKDGKEIEVRITVAKIEQIIPGIINNETELLYAFYTDITAEKEAINVAKNAVQRDALTGLYTRSYFLRKSASLTEFSSIEDFHALIFIDIANFSEFNLLKGHKVGDEFLKKVSQRLKMVLREGDTIARPYADEFWILIEKAGKSYETAKTNVKTILSKLINELSKAYVFDNTNSDGSETYEANFYVGVHLFSVLDTPEEALRKANVALSKSKVSQDRLVFYTISIDNELQEKAVKEKALKMALYNGELKIFLQPICNYSGNILGAEALLRWVKKDGTVLPPYEFIELLEENGMIIPVGEDVLRQVCEFLTIINKNSGNNINNITFVDLNVSPIQLRDPELGKRFSEIIKAYDISPSKIVLEFTENILIDMNKDVKKNIEYLLDSGFELCIDDFGAGYSSLSYLTILPIRKIKIDRSFVFNIPSDRRSIKLLEAIYNIARSFNLEAIPEGVESEKQLEILSMIGFKLFQGFFFGKPVPVDEFIKRFTKN